jgi:oxygen-independent coproporphyrinogen-3 oxidase
MLGIYVHIPYCRTLCPYCDFVKQRVRGAAPSPFVDALCQEIAAYDGPREAQSIFFGGGTPSLLAPDDLARILETLAAQFHLVNAEITLEANPDDVTEDLMRAWRAAGVNRVSLGVQSFDKRCLKYLGRRHDAAQALRACEIIAAHFDTWNLDLIFGARPVEAWDATLAQAVALRPPHVAAYGLTYENGTPFERRRDEALDEDISLAMYQQLEAALADYDHYEISNFAKPGHQSRHNLVYWENGPYAGFGTGAYSFLNGVRARNVISTDEYLRAPGAKCESLILDAAEIRVETVIQHLRLRTGLPRAHYRARFGHDVLEDYGEVLADAAARGLVTIDDTHILPTAEGFYLNNEIGLALVG